MTFKLFENRQTDWLDRQGNPKPDADLVAVSIHEPDYFAGWMSRPDANGLLKAHNEGTEVELTVVVDSETSVQVRGKVVEYVGRGEDRITIAIVPPPEAIVDTMELSAGDFGVIRREDLEGEQAQEAQANAESGSVSGAE